jgi:hypothetical protein
MGKRSSLFPQIIRDGEKKFYNIGTKLNVPPSVPIISTRANVIDIFVDSEEM